MTRDERETLRTSLSNGTRVVFFFASGELEWKAESILSLLDRLDRFDAAEGLLRRWQSQWVKITSDPIDHDTLDFLEGK